MQAMNMFGKLMLLAASLGTLSAYAAPLPGSCEEAAIEIKNPSADQAFDVRLTPFYNSEIGVYDQTNLVCFYKVTLSRGKEYSLYLAGDDELTPAAGVMDFYDIYPRAAMTDSEFEPGAQFQAYSGKWKPGLMQVMVEDEWWIEYNEDGSIDEEMSDPKSWSYFIQLAGTNMSASVKLHFVPGNALPIGIEDNPVPIVPAIVPKETKAQKFVDGEFSFYHSAEFVSGRRYLFASRGGTVSNSYFTSFGADGKVTPYAAWAEDGGDAWSFDPSTDGEGTVAVFEPEPDAKATFTLKYAVLPIRSIKQHQSEELEVGEEGAKFVPGRINATDNEYYDQIIDQALFHCELERGKAYVAETFGSKTNLLMRIYDSTGKILRESALKGDGTGDVRCGYKPTYSGDFYIGVCQKLEDDDLDEPLADNEVLLKIDEIAGEPGVPDEWDPEDDVPAGATPIAPVPADLGRDPAVADSEGTPGWHKLDRTDWADLFAVAVRAGMTYEFSASDADGTASQTTLKAKVFWLKGVAEQTVKTSGEIWPGTGQALTFSAEKDAIYYVRLSVAEGESLVHPQYKVHAIAYETESGMADRLGMLKVNTKGCDTATWTLAGISYPGGMSVVLPAGSWKVSFSKEKGFSVPQTTSLSVTAGKLTEHTGVYSDTYDPKDDDSKGAASWSLKNVLTSQGRTLWAEDPADWFKFSAKDGYFYDFAFDSKAEAGDAAMTLLDTNKGVVQGLSGVQAIEKVGLTKGTYYLKVAHANDGDRKDDAYAVSGKFANVGAVQFAKAAVSAKDNATSVSLTVKRSAKDGRLRVRYATADGTAVAGGNYVAQEGVLEWEDGDNKAKTITIKLIPKLIAAWNGGNKAFAVKLTDAGDGDYEASILGDTATVTILETSKSSVTIESVYAKKAPKQATTTTEVGALRGGTFYGIVRAEKAIRDNGIYELAAITLTVSAKGGVDDTTKDSLSAKVTLAGKTYSFKTASKEPPWDDPEATLKTKTLSLVSKISGASYENTLKLTVKEGLTTSATDWLDAVATAELEMNVPDASDKGVLNISYAGGLYRQNARIQEYLYRVKDFAGYYTVVLANPNADETLAPAGHGYLTVAVDNKGTAKVAGLLADGTKVSFSVTASALREDGRGGLVMVMPLFASKSPYCFGGEIVLRQKAISSVKPDGRLVNPDGKTFDVVVSAPAGELVWNNDNATLTRGGANGWALSLHPVGGWYDTVFNLQSYYKDYAFSVATTDIAEFPKEVLPDGYSFVTGGEARQQPNGHAVDLQGDAFAVAKKSLTKIGGLVDLNGSVNPYDVQLKLARATGVLTGSFSLWSYSEAQKKQKEISGIKHFGILVLQRDDSAVLGENCLTAGFFNQKATVKDGGMTRSWTISKPFNILSELNPNSGTGEGD